MKRILILVLAGLLFAGVAIGQVPCKRTGLQIDNSQAADTVFFFYSWETGCTPEQFTAHSLWISLDASASGPVTIQRGMKGGSGYSTPYFIDDAFTAQPGNSRLLYDDGITCFKFTKTGASDELRYSASICEQNIIDMQTGLLDSLIALASVPPPVTVEAGIPLINLLDIPAGTAKGSVTYAVVGTQLDGAKSGLLHLEWNHLTGYFGVQSVITSTLLDLNGVGVNIVGRPDTACVDAYTTAQRVDSLMVVQADAREFVDIPLTIFSGGMMCGFYHVRIYYWFTTDLRDLTATLRLVK